MASTSSSAVATADAEEETSPLTAATVGVTAQPGSSVDGEVMAAPGLPGRLLSGVVGLLTCRRRAAGAKADSSICKSSPAYEALRKRAQSLSDDDKAAFQKMAWWSKAETKSGAKVFVLAPRGPQGDMECYIDMWNLFAYTASQMHDHVVKREQRFAVVWVQCSDHRVSPFTAMTFKRHLHERYASCLDAVHVVHPSWTVRCLRLALWPIASYEFWDQFECHERVEFLDTYMNGKKLELPDDIYEYDKFLDRQAEETSKEAAKTIGGHGGLGMFNSLRGMEGQHDAVSLKYKEQMEEMQRLLQEKDRGNKTD